MDSSPAETAVSAAALQRHYEDRVLTAIRAGDYSKPDTWFALNARMAFSMARIAVAKDARNQAHRRLTALALSRYGFLRSVETLQSANIGADCEERL